MTHFKTDRFIWAAGNNRQTRPDVNFASSRAGSRDPCWPVTTTQTELASVKGSFRSQLIRFRFILKVLHNVSNMRLSALSGRNTGSGLGCHKGRSWRQRGVRGTFRPPERSPDAPADPEAVWCRAGGCSAPGKQKR